MVFKFPNNPSAEADTHELADFAELLCWTKTHISARELVAYLGRVDENDHNEGCEDDESENDAKIDEVMNELDRRGVACRGGYPFSFSKGGGFMSIVEGPLDSRSIVYLYLLLATRLNMSDDKVQGGIDGALILEELAAEVLRRYLGLPRARAMVFGTASQGAGFGQKVEELCKTLGDGGGYRSVDASGAAANDGRLDAVAWIPFADALPGQLVIFCQCKSGTSWNSYLCDLQPGSFLQKWTSLGFTVVPVRAFCITEAVNRARWRSICIDAGLVVDRCRIVDLADELDAPLLLRLRDWAFASLDRVKEWSSGTHVTPRKVRGPKTAK